MKQDSLETVEVSELPPAKKVYRRLYKRRLQ